MLNPLLTFIKRTHQTVTSLFLVVALTLTAQAQDSTPKAHIVRVKRGQVLAFSLLNSVDSGHAQKGDDVSLTLMRPFVADGVTVLPVGWIAHTKLKTVVRAGENCKTGRIDWNLSRLDVPGKRKLKLQPISEYQATHDGQFVDRVALGPTPAKSALQLLSTVPLVILFLPIEVPFVIALAMGNNCGGGPGREASEPAGAEFYFAITKDADMVTYQDTPVNVTLEPVSH